MASDVVQAAMGRIQEQQAAFQAAMGQIQQQQGAFVESLQFLQTNHENLQKTVSQLVSHLSSAEWESPADAAGLKDLQRVQVNKFTDEGSFHAHVNSQMESYNKEETTRGQKKTFRASNRVNRLLEEPLPPAQNLYQTGMTCESQFANNDPNWMQKLRGIAAKIVKSKPFEVCASLVILLNLITIGIQADLELNSAPPLWMTAVERSFLFVYTVEVTLRFVAKGPNIFCDAWFLLDFFLVLTGMFFLVAAPLMKIDFRDWDKVLVIRGLRLLRLARVLRLLGRFKDVWRLVYGIVNSSLTIASSAILAFLMLYIFGCMAVEFITKDDRLALMGDEGDGNVAEIVAHNFGSVPRAILTLLQFMTMDSIAGIYFPLIMAKPVLFFFFVPILWLMGVALMNLVAAIFVENALELAEEEADVQANRKKQKVKEALPGLLAAFERMDVDSDGCLTEEELAQLPIDVIPAKDLKKLSVNDMTELFQLLDVDGRGVLTQSEFVDSLLDLTVLEVPMWSLQSLRFLRMINDRVMRIERDVEILSQFSIFGI